MSKDGLMEHTSWVTGDGLVQTASAVRGEEKGAMSLRERLW